MRYVALHPHRHAICMRKFLYGDEVLGARSQQNNGQYSLGVLVFWAHDDGAPVGAPVIHDFNQKLWSVGQSVGQSLNVFADRGIALHALRSRLEDSQDRSVRDSIQSDCDSGRVRVRERRSVRHASRLWAFDVQFPQSHRP